MKNLFIVFYLILSTQYLFPVTENKPKYEKFSFPKKCTKDINPWGNPSHCYCNKEEKYIPQLGKCLRQKHSAKRVYETGIILAPVFSIGGETTGIHLKKDNKEEIELVLDHSHKEKIKDLYNKQINIYGQIFYLEGIEKKQRKILVVETLDLTPTPK